MTLLLDVAFAATVLFAAGWMAAVCLRSASADVRRTIWRAVFAGWPRCRSCSRVSRLRPRRRSSRWPPCRPAVSAATQAAADVPWLLVIWASALPLSRDGWRSGLVQVRRWGRGAVSGDGADFSAAITVPMTWGVVRPQILLPAEARAWTEEARDLVVRHEAAHVASRDWAWQTMARLVTAAVVVSSAGVGRRSRSLRREAERAADDAGARGGAESCRVCRASSCESRARCRRRRPRPSRPWEWWSRRRSSIASATCSIGRAGRGPASWIVRAARRGLRRRAQRFGRRHAGTDRSTTSKSSG